MLCAHCGEPTLRPKFCSDGCKVKYFHAIKRYFPCPTCGVERISKSPLQDCNTCAASKRALPGSKNPNWKGGHKHWSKGRYGKDKAGLSWKTQRKLAWERDSYTCQHCGVKGRRNPDVHHINPWLNSQSHALDNLICLCQSCHLKEEATVHEEWGGQLLSQEVGFQPKRPLTPCTLCGVRHKVLPNPQPYICKACSSKVCPRCGVEKNEVTFSKGSKGRLDSMCKGCRSLENRKSYLKKHPVLDQ